MSSSTELLFTTHQLEIRREEKNPCCVSACAGISWTVMVRDPQHHADALGFEQQPLINKTMCNMITATIRK